MDNQEYEQKKRECWEEFWDEISGNIDFTPGVPDRIQEHIYTTFDRAYALGKQEKDAEGEEMLTVPRSKVQEIYCDNCVEIHRECVSSSDKDCYQTVNEVLKTLFSSKCLLDDVDSLAHLEPKAKSDFTPIPEKTFVSNWDKSERKFKVGDIAVVRGFKHPLLEHDGAIVSILSYHEKGDFYSCAIAPNVGIDIDAKYLEPYTEPEETSPNVNHSDINIDELVAKGYVTDPAKSFDTILKDSFSKERRLNIATRIMAAMLSNQMMLNNLAHGETTAEGVVKCIVDATMMYTDALIAECEK